MAEFSHHLPHISMFSSNEDNGQVQSVNMIKFSIIMPVHNAGIYLGPAIQSILNQSYGNFELLLVVDGPTDGSGDVCDQFARQDNRIHVFHRHNQGICASRNFGLSVATGDYVMFCDHDDEYFSGYLQKIHDNIQELSITPPPPALAHAAQSQVCTLPEVVKTGFKLVDRWQDGRCVETYGGDQMPSFTWDKGSNYTYFIKLSVAVWDGAYQRDFLNRNSLRFNEKFKYGSEDFDFMIHVLSCAKRAYWINGVSYCHYSNFGASTSTKHHAERFDDILDCAKTEEKLFPTEDARLKMERYRRWNSALLSSAIAPAGKNLSTLAKYRLVRQYKKSLLPCPPNPFSKQLTINERVYALICNVPMLHRCYSLMLALKS